MNYNIFQTQVIQSLQSHFPSHVNISIQKIPRNNTADLDGLIIQDPATNIAPTLYLNYYYHDYQNGMSFSDVISRILSDYHQYKSSESLDLSFFTQYEQAKYHLICKLIHYDSNRELLKNAPHYRFLDLAIVFCCLLLDTQHGNAAILILNHHLDYWHITKEELYRTAKVNTPILLPVLIQPLEELLKHLPEWNPSYSDSSANLYVCSNPANFYGAATLLYPQAITAFANSHKCDFYILPSSIHEILLMPADEDISPDILKKMICEVNQTQLQPEEILSDHPYYFSRETSEITMI